MPHDCAHGAPGNVPETFGGGQLRDADHMPGPPLSEPAPQPAPGRPGPGV